jgi:hypothetical protein
MAVSLYTHVAVHTCVMCLRLAVPCVAPCAGGRVVCRRDLLPDAVWQAPLWRGVQPGADNEGEGGAQRAPGEGGTAGAGLVTAGMGNWGLHASASVVNCAWHCQDLHPGQPDCTSPATITLPALCSTKVPPQHCMPHHHHHHSHPPPHLPTSPQPLTSPPLNPAPRWTSPPSPQSARRQRPSSSAASPTSRRTAGTCSRQQRTPTCASGGPRTAEGQQQQQQQLGPATGCTQTQCALGSPRTTERQQQQQQQQQQLVHTAAGGDMRQAKDG